MEEKSKLIETTDKMIKYAFPYVKNVNRKLVKVTNISTYSVTGNQIGYKLIDYIIKYMGTNELIITDMTANVGSDTIKFGLRFNYVNAIEYDPLTCNLLKNNIKVYNLNNKVNVMCGDSSTIINNLEQDVLYMDPPWGGPDYIKHKSLDMKLGTTDIVDIIIKNINKAKLFIIKCPRNYNFNNLLHKLAPFNVYIHSIKRNPIEDNPIREDQHVKMQFIFINMANYFIEGIKFNNKIRILSDIIQYRNFIYKSLKDYTSIKNMKNIINNSTDLEFYAYYHQKFKESSKFKNFDKVTSEYLHSIYDRRVDLISKVIDLNNKIILDVGTEDCYFIDLLNKYGKANGINVGTLESYKGNRDCITIYDGINIPFNKDTYDVIIILMSIHHMECYEETLRNVYRVLKPNGKLFIYEHDFRNDISNAMIDVYHFFFELIKNKRYNIDYFNNYDVHYITKKHLDKTLKRIGFKYESNEILNKYNSKRYNPLKLYYSIYYK
jgi:SAM-dependent methyltransferase/predicted RNA methylase